MEEAQVINEKFSVKVTVDGEEIELDEEELEEHELTFKPSAPAQEMHPKEDEDSKL